MYQVKAGALAAHAASGPRRHRPLVLLPGRIGYEPAPTDPEDRRPLRNEPGNDPPETKRARVNPAASYAHATAILPALTCFA